MNTALRTVLSYPLAPFDPDTRAYITAVERADGQALEARTRQALDAFVRGCKADGIWNAIKACCILMGARTLAGALVPLKGTAPTNFNFVSGDYNRKTGLLGNGSTKYLDSNRSNNADPQNNQHVSVLMSAAPTTGATLLGAVQSQTGATNLLVGGSRSRSATADTYAATALPGFVGISRSEAAAYTQRVNGASATATRTSEASATQNITIFVRYNPIGLVFDTFSNPRLSFYSIGESLDLALFDARVTALSTAIAAAF